MYYTLLAGRIRPPLSVDMLAAGHRSVGSTALRLALPGTPILLAGGKSRGMMCVLEGCVCLYQSLPDGRRQILDVLGPGQMLGSSLCDLDTVQAVAMTYSRLEEVNPDALWSDNAQTLRNMLARSLAHATLLGRKSASEKVATALIDLATRFPRKTLRPRRNTHAFNLYLTRADMADWLGLTLETVSRCFSAFKREGLIAVDRPSKVVTVFKRDTLIAIASGLLPNPAGEGETTVG